MSRSKHHRMFGDFEPYILSGVQVTDRELGRGSYAAVVELDYRGLKCAGKKIHQTLSEQGVSYSLNRFAEECHLLSQTRHPNVVQFLGVYFGRKGTIPALVMEFLPTNLSSCVDNYGILPKEISYSVLHDVSLGLNYLHNQTPPNIHRDLSANNVLLTPNMTAKISDLGVAKILNLTPLQMSHMTATPGTPTYMPPEVMVADPRYNTSMDVFSYGIMMIHVFSGEWPHPKVGQVHVGSDGKLIPVSEAERREVYLHTIGQDHPLMDLILRCISNDPPKRGNAYETVQQLKDIVLKFPPSFANKLDMLSRIQAMEKAKRNLVATSEKKDEENERGLKQIEEMEEEFVNLEKQYERRVECLKLVHSTEIELLRSEMGDLNTKMMLLTAEKEVFESEVETLKHMIKVHEKTMELYERISNTQKEALAQKDDTIKALNDQLTRTKEYLSSKQQVCSTGIVSVVVYCVPQYILL